MSRNQKKKAALQPGNLISFPLGTTPDVLLQEIARHPVVGQIIPFVCDLADVDAKADASFPYRQPNARGVRYTMQVLYHFGVALKILGFVEDPKDGQVRFLSPTYFSTPVRFVCVRAPLFKGGYSIGEDRKCFETLCKSNGIQLSLFEESEQSMSSPGGIITVWVIFTSHATTPNTHVDTYSVTLVIGNKLKGGVLRGFSHTISNRVEVGSISRSFSPDVTAFVRSLIEAELLAQAQAAEAVQNTSAAFTISERDEEVEQDDEHFGEEQGEDKNFLAS